MFIYCIKLKKLIAIFCGIIAVTIITTAGVNMHKPASTVPQESGVPVPIVMYHSILNKSSRLGDYVLSPSQLENDLIYIKNLGYETVFMQDLIDYVKEGKPLPKKPIIISFDDGYYNNYTYAYPLLKQHKMKGVLSIIGKWADHYTTHPDANKNYAHASWDNLKEMSDSGVMEIQNHTYDLHTNGSRKGARKMRNESMEHYTQAITYDANLLQSCIQKYIGKTPTTYTYPFGAVSSSSYQIIKNLGFAATLSCEEGVSAVTRDPDSLYMLKRYNRAYGKNSADFFSKFLK